MGGFYILFKPIKTAASIKSRFEEEALINQEWVGLGGSPDSTICSPESRPCLDGGVRGLNAVQGRGWGGAVMWRK